jgi:hypothetical protein
MTSTVFHAPPDAGNEDEWEYEYSTTETEVRTTFLSQLVQLKLTTSRPTI